MNINKTYFSPRLNNERLRISKLVVKDERILVMFSGIGIYCFIISKFSKAKEIFGVEINPDAHIFAEKNLLLNKIKNVKLFCGNVKIIVPKLKTKFDRIMMPLPKTSENFLDLAIKYLKNNGIIHFYCFSKLDEINNLANKLSSEYNLKILNIVKCGQSSPKEYRFCIDFKKV